MSGFAGRSELVRVANMDAVADRLRSAGVRFLFVNHPDQRSDRDDVVEVRYEDTPRAIAYVAEYRVPPNYWDED